MLRSRALAGRRFETWDEVTEAVAQAPDEWTRTAILSSGGTAAGTAPPRPPGIDRLPKAA